MVDGGALRKLETRANRSIRMATFRLERRVFVRDRSEGRGGGFKRARVGWLEYV